MKSELLFIHTSDDGQIFKVYTDGKTEGFPQGMSSTYFRARIEQDNCALLQIANIIGSYNPSILSWAKESIPEEDKLQGIKDLEKRINNSLESTRNQADALHEKRLRHTPRVWMGVASNALAYLNEGKPEQAISTLECSIKDLKQSFPDYPWEDTAKV